MKIYHKLLRQTVLVLCLLGSATCTYAQAEDSLTTYIVAAIHNNPGVMGEYRAYEAQVMGACGEGQLSDPTVTVGAYPSPMQHVNVKQLATVSVMQMFPWFGTLKAGRQMMEHKAEAAYQKFREKGIALAFDMQRQWYAMLATQEKLKSVRAKLLLLKDIEQVALYQYKSPAMAKGARMSDQLRLQAEEARLEERIESLEDELRLQRQQFNIVMNREESEPIVLPDTIVLREMPVVTWDEVEKNSPQLSKLLAEGRAYEAQEAKATGMGKPMVGIGLQYMLNGKVDMPMMADMNGKDMLMPMVSVTLPIYRRKIHAARKAAMLLKQSTDWGYQREQDALRAQYLSIVQRAADERRKLALYRKEMQILDHTLQLMTTEYANGSTSLTDILQTSREQIDYALMQAEAHARYNTIVAEYEKMASRHDYAERSLMNKK